MTASAQRLLEARPMPDGEAPSAEVARVRAGQRLRADGIPSRRDEYWRFTAPEPLAFAPGPGPVKPVAALDEKAAVLDVRSPDRGSAGREVGSHPSGPGEAVSPADPISAPGARALAADALRIVFVDGRLRRDLSDPLMLDGVEIEPLDAALARQGSWACRLFGRIEARGGVLPERRPVRRPLASLNTARAVDGLVIRVVGRVARPVEILSLRGPREPDSMVPSAAPADDGGPVFLHHLLRLEAGAELTLIERGIGDSRSNLVVEAELADGAALQHLRLQGDAAPAPQDARLITGVFARLGAGARLKAFTMTGGGATIRNETFVELAGAAASAHVAVAGIAGAAGDPAAGDPAAGPTQDDTIFVAHQAPGCESRQVVRKILAGAATGVFQGKILVDRVAQQTDGYQIARAVLRDPRSRFLVKPELEIYADDVRCSHGTTAGAVDEAALFYLMSRGVPRAAAEALLLRAFLDEAIAEIEDADLAEAVRGRIRAWLR